MNIRRCLWIALSVIAATCGQDVVASDVADLFVKAPRSVLPLLEQSSRLDMVDYFRSGMSTPSSNVMDGKARITDMSDRSLTLEISNVSTLQMVLLPFGKEGNVICCIFTLKTPQPDSWVEFYSTDWTRMDTGRFFREPSVSDWLTREGRRHYGEICEQLPFVLASCECVFPGDSGTCELVMKNQMDSYFDPEQYDRLRQWMEPELTFRWTGKMFRRR